VPTLRHVLVIGVDGVRFHLPGIRPGGPPAVTRQDQVVPLVLGALG
jgi:hypothetical protein